MKAKWHDNLMPTDFSTPLSPTEPFPPIEEEGTVIEIEFIVDDLRTALPTLTGSFDRIFHDPFSPQHLPELWTQELFETYFRLLAPKQGALLTYSAAAAVRGGLLEAGFSLGRTIGVGDKTGGTAAWAPSEEIQAKADCPEPTGDTFDSETPKIPGQSPTVLPNSGFLKQIQPLTPWEQAYIASRAGIPYRDPDLTTSRSAILERRQQEQDCSERVSGAVLLKQKMNGYDGDDRHVHAHARNLRESRLNPADDGCLPRDNVPLP